MRRTIMLLMAALLAFGAVGCNNPHVELHAQTIENCQSAIPEYEAALQHLEDKGVDIDWTPGCFVDSGLPDGWSTGDDHPSSKRNGDVIITALDYVDRPELDTVVDGNSFNGWCENSIHLEHNVDRSIYLHELGHYLGLEHLDDEADEDNVMFWEVTDMEIEDWQVDDMNDKLDFYRAWCG